MVELSDNIELKIWLHTQPPEVSVAIAARCALRVLPVLFEARRAENFYRAILLPVSRAIAISAFVGIWPKAEIAAADAARAADATIAARTAMVVAAANADAAATADANFILRLSKHIGLEVTLKRLAMTSLWHGDLPDEISRQWALLKLSLPQAQNWQVWTDWYEARLTGFKSPALPLIFELERERIEISNADWEHENNPAHVNEIIAALEAKYRSEHDDPADNDEEDLSIGDSKDKPATTSKPRKGNASPETDIYKSITEAISRAPDIAEDTTVGLITLVRAERQLESEKPPLNDPDSIAAQTQRLEFFDQLLLGLEGIKSSLVEDPPTTTVQKIDETLLGLETWYVRQPSYVQKSIRATGVISFAAGGIALGLPALMTLPFLACFFAKDEMREATQMIRKGWSEAGPSE